MITRAETALRRFRAGARITRADVRALDEAAELLHASRLEDDPARVVPRAPSSPRGCMM